MHFVNTYQRDKVQQVHARFIGLGVGQSRQRREFEAHCVSSVTPLRQSKQALYFKVKIFKVLFKYLIR